MRNIFYKGFLSVFLVGVIFFFGKVVIYDFLVGIFRPIIKSTLGINEEYLIVILTVVLIILIMFVAGLIPFGMLFKRKGIEKSHGAFILISPGIQPKPRQNYQVLNSRRWSPDGTIV